MTDTTQEQDVLAIGDWADNGRMIADIAKLGYISGRILDATYGMGTFWKHYLPPGLITNDIRTPAMFAYDHQAEIGIDPSAFPVAWRQSYDTVVDDPDYKLNGTPTDTPRYGVDVPKTVKERLAGVAVSAVNCSILVRKGGHLIVKCQDQVANGVVHWQTDMVTEVIAKTGRFRKVDAFLYQHHHRPQRSQVHARRNYSTALIFRATKA